MKEKELHDKESHISPEPDSAQFWKEKFFGKGEAVLLFDAIEKIERGEYTLEETTVHESEKDGSLKEVRKITIKDREGKTVFYGNASEYMKIKEVMPLRPREGKKEDWH